jgi:hypothetical protein
MNNYILITIFCSRDPSRRYLACIVVAFNEPLLTEFIYTMKCWEDHHDSQGLNAAQHFWRVDGEAPVVS